MFQNCDCMMDQTKNMGCSKPRIEQQKRLVSQHKQERKKKSFLEIGVTHGGKPAGQWVVFQTKPVGNAIFIPFCQTKKTGNEHGKKQNKEKYAMGNCQWDQSFVMLFIFSWDSRRLDIPCPGFKLSNSLQTSPHVVSL